MSTRNRHNARGRSRNRVWAQVERRQSGAGLGRKRRIAASENGMGEGILYWDTWDGDTLVESREIGRNALSRAFRIIVAKILARKVGQVPSGVTFPYSAGFDASDDVFPQRIYVGTGTSPALESDTSLEYYLTEEDTSTAAPLYFDLSRIEVRDTYAEYVSMSKPIHVAFEFDIPLGTLRSGLNAETTAYILTEFALVAGDGSDHPVLGPSDGSAQTPQGDPPTQLARKVTSVLKNPLMAYTLRWEIRT